MSTLLSVVAPSPHVEHVDDTPWAVPAVIPVGGASARRRRVTWTRVGSGPSTVGVGGPALGGRGAIVVPCATASDGVHVFTRPWDACLGSAPRARPPVESPVAAAA